MSKTFSKTNLKTLLTWDNVIFAIILCAIIFYFFFQVVILKTTSPQVAVTTTSMVPTYEGFDLTENYDITPHQYYDILRGDLLIVQNIPPHVGDVVVFKVQTETTPIVHRLVVERVVDGVIQFGTKGDHNPTTDIGTIGNNFGWINESQILGVVVFAIHYVGWLSLQLQNPFIRVFLIVAVLAIIVLTIFDGSNKSKEKEKNKVEKDTVAKISRKIYLKFKSYKIQIYRPTFFLLMFLVMLIGTYAGIGVANYSSNQNTVHPLIINNQVIDLRGNLVEKYSNIYLYDYELNISSSGFLNTVSKVVVQAVYNNLTTQINNQAYVWTIVYDYAGTKSINSLLEFNVTPGMANIPIETTLTYTIYSSGLLASPVKTYSLNVVVIA